MISFASWMSKKSLLQLLEAMALELKSLQQLLSITWIDSLVLFNMREVHSIKNIMKLIKNFQTTSSVQIALT